MANRGSLTHGAYGIRDYALVSRQEQEGRRWRWHWRPVGVTVAFLAALIFGILFWFGVRHGRSRLRVQAAAELKEGLTDCTVMLTNIDIWTDQLLCSVSDVVSAAACRSRCETSPRCAMWTWGSKPGVPGLTEVCFLKALSPDLQPMGRRKLGVISGFPCRGPSTNYRFTGSSAATGSACEGAGARAGSRGGDAATPTTVRSTTELVDASTPMRTSSPITTTSRSSSTTTTATRTTTVTSTSTIVTTTTATRTTTVTTSTLTATRTSTSTSSSTTLTTTEPTSTSSSTTTLQATTKSISRGVSANLSKALSKVNCRQAEDGVDYHTKRPLFDVHDVGTEEMCSARCEGQTDCGAWTWGKANQVVGVAHVCFLKALEPGEQIQKLTKASVVSGQPCRVRTHAVPPGTPAVPQRPHSLYCYVLMRPVGYELDLMKMQFAKKVGIFQCDEPAVYSNQVIHIAPGLDTGVVQSSLQCEVGGEFKTALNLDIFRAVWEKVVSDGRFQNYEWTVKADPDCVFFPDRLRAHVSDLHLNDIPNGVYLNNCKFGMHGPIEAFSKNAVLTWYHGTVRCVNHFTRLCNGPCQWGEDMFIDQCMQRVLHVKRVNDYSMLAEDHCDPLPGWNSCTNASFVAFHPFKSPPTFEACLGSAGR